MKMISMFKNLCPLNTLLKIKYILSVFDQREIEITKPSKKIYYLDAPDYGNLGDQAIALSIRKFALMNFSDYEFIEILQKDVSRYIKSLKKQIKNDDIIFLTGGGNMGNIYKIFEATRRFVIKQFPNNKIVVFPQTIDYTNNIFGHLSCKYSKKVYSGHKNLILCAREDVSYQKMKKLYPNATVVLCPDIVLSLDKCYEANTAQDVSLCLRNDCETSLTDTDRKYINNLLKNEDLTTRSISTSAGVVEISEENRENLIYEKLKDFSFSRFVITDRLHAMLFCYLTNTPCIAFGNSNYKIKGVYNFIKGVPYIKFLDNIDYLEDVIHKFKFLPLQQGKVKLDFSTVVKIIKGD